MTPYLAGAARPQQQHHHQQRSPRAPELHRRPDGDVGQQPQRRPGGPRPTRRSPRPRTELSENGIGDGGLVAAPAGRTVDLVRASQWIKRRNAPPKPLVFQCRLLAMTRYLAGAARPQQQHRQQQRSPRAPELHRRPQPESCPTSSPQRRPGRPETDAAIAAAPNRISLKWNRRRRPGGGPQRVALSTSCARVNG